MILDYDVISREEVENDAKRLDEKYGLGGYEIEASDTNECWHVLFPKTAIDSFEKALEIAEDSKCERDWLEFCKRYKIFAIKTALVKTFQPNATRKVFSRPVDEILSPVILTVKPKTKLDLKRVIKLSESTHDHTWVWKIDTPILGIYDEREELSNVMIGCKDVKQAGRRISFIKKLEIDADFEVKV